MRRDLLIVGGIAILFPASCAAVQMLDPVQPPPGRFRQSRPALVEFVGPEIVSQRCGQLGAQVLANACSDFQRIVIGNPCEYPGAYAAMMCHELGHLNGWAANHQDKSEPVLPMARESPEAVAYEQELRGF